MKPESDKYKQAITISQRYLGTIVTTKDIDEIRSEELRQERIFRKHVLCPLNYYTHRFRIYC